MAQDCTPTEILLIEGSRKGSAKYQELLYKHFYGFGLSISLRYAADKAEAVSVLNDSFLKVFDQLKKNPPPRSFRGWLRRIITNTAIDHFRREQKHQRHSDLSPVAEEVPSSEGDTVSHLSAESILELLARLPAHYRLVFILYELEGYSHEEIARQLNISVSSSRVYLTRAKETLRQSINSHFSIPYARSI